MSLQNVKDWLEIIALVGVIGSLIAVVVELRQTQTALQAQAYQSRAFDSIAWNAELAKDENLRALSERLYQPDYDPATLSPSELSMAKHLMTITRDLDNEHYQNGLLDPGFYQGETI